MLDQLAAAGSCVFANSTEEIMSPRIDMTKYLSSGLGRALLALQRQVESSGLERSLVHIMKIRASQINGCAYCIDMHTQDARAEGESEQRIYALSAWRETPFFTDRERAALEWTETLTLIATTHVPDDVYASVGQHFSESEMVALTFAVITINCWNRIAIPFRAPVGTYRPQPVGA
jgi:AhpD family alkylhydroperoxidase